MACAGFVPSTVARRRLRRGVVAEPRPGLPARARKARTKAVAVCSSSRDAGRAVVVPGGPGRAVAVSRAVRRRQASGPRPDAGGKPDAAVPPSTSRSVWGALCPDDFVTVGKLCGCGRKGWDSVGAGGACQSGETPKDAASGGALITPVPFSPIQPSIRRESACRCVWERRGDRGVLLRDGCRLAGGCAGDQTRHGWSWPGRELRRMPLVAAPEKGRAYSAGVVGAGRLVRGPEPRGSTAVAVVRAALWRRTPGVLPLGRVRACR